MIFEKIRVVKKYYFIIFIFFYNTLLHIYTKEKNIKVKKIIITLIHTKTKRNNEQSKSKKRKEG